MSRDARIGSAFLFAGIGYGGSCFPKDTRALVQSARKLEFNVNIVEAAEQVNETQKQILLPKLLSHFGGSIAGKTIALWGLAFKPRTDDIRDAPALVLIEKILAAKAKVRAFDPEAMNNVKKQIGAKIEYCANSYDALKSADALIVATEWNEFRSPAWDRVKSLLSIR